MDVKIVYYRVPEAVYGDNQDMLGEVFVDTVDTVSIFTHYLGPFLLIK